LEANSQRVLCRLLGERGDPRQGEVRRRLWGAAEALLPRRHVGEFNQALMELGALVCTHAAPRCKECPLAVYCEARRVGRPEEVPARATPAAVVLVEEAGVVVRRGEDVLLVQRPDGGRWAGMWEFPHAALEMGEAHDAAACRVVRELTGLDAELGE